MPGCVAVAERQRQADPRSRAVAPLLVLAFALGAGCQSDLRRPHCDTFVIAADACYAQAGLDPFFADSVDCAAPVSSIREYKCLAEHYDRAVDNDLCRSPEDAAVIVDFVSLTCLGWSGETSDDDDSAR